MAPIPDTRRLLLCASVLALLAACSTPPSRFYHLDAAAPDAAPPRSADAQRRVIGLEGVKIPGYLDRPELVLRAPGNRLVVMEFDRWGSPIDEMVTRALLRNLEADLPGAEVVGLPLQREFPLSQVVEVTLDRFDAAEGGPAVLEARWRVFDQGGDRLRRLGHTAVQEPVGGAADRGADPGAVAEALGRTLARLAQDIASALR
ncbi:PqiC family protein [Azospirillum isscasi]|uniref:PqiC family protein n=1 Tax=Azospirillum isscasi TaxID=3053926 RepID=A0ABU0WFC3_9PROT|nr:PqiC family protein [Azospirillum isscasi]MDQ2102758.1 PqiC family protein [Azospirillum isscasi]